MQKARKSRKIRKTTSLKEPVNADEQNEKVTEFQQYFHSITKLILPLRKVPHLSDAQRYNGLLNQKREELKFPNLVQSVKKYLFLDLDETLVHSGLIKINEVKESPEIISENMVSDNPEKAAKTIVRFHVRPH